MKKFLLFATVAATAFGVQAQTQSTDWGMAVEYVRTHIADAKPELKAAAEQAIVDNEGTQDIAALYAACEQAILSNSRGEGLPMHIDFTSKVVNPKAEDGVNGWTMAQNINGQNSFTLLSGERPSDGSGAYWYWDGNYNATDWTCSIEQSVALPAGKYRIAVMGRGNINEDTRPTFERFVAAADIDDNKEDGHLLNYDPTELPHVDIVPNGNREYPGAFTNGWFDWFFDYETDGRTNTVLAFQASASAVHNWVSFTNVRVTKIGDVEINLSAEELAALVAEGESLLASEDYVNVTGVERTDLAAALKDSPVVPSKLSNAVTMFKLAKGSYDKWVALAARIKGQVKDASAEKLAAVQPYFTATSAQEAETAYAGLQKYGREAILSSHRGEGLKNYADKTDAIMFASPTSNADCSAWYLDAIGEYTLGKVRTMSNEKPAIDMTLYYDTDNWDMELWSIDFYQILDVEPGTYRLQSVMRGRDGFDSYNLYASNGETKATTPVECIGNAGGDFNRGWNSYYVDIEVRQNEQLTVGVEATSSQKSRWLSFGDFHLSKIEKESALESIVNDANGPVQIFDLNGREVSGKNLTNGIYVRRQGSKVTKFIVR